MRQLPGVQYAALASRLPIRNPGGNVAGWNPEAPPVDASEAGLVYTRRVSPGYFETLGIPIHEGRGVTPDGLPGTAEVAVVNRTLAERLFPGEQALGRTLALDRGSRGVGLVEIIGVVGDVKLDGLQNEAPMAAYMPFAQAPPVTMRLAVRTSGIPDAPVGSLRDLLRGMDPDVPLADPGMMRGWVGQSVAFTGRVTQAVGAFAVVALLLASLGLYGVLAFQVAERRREIGVRMALGAETGKVVREVVGSGAVLVAVGVAGGLLAATAAVRLIQGMLFGVRATDPVSLAGAVLFIVALGLAACIVPAWRAGRVDPSEALVAE